MDNIRPPVFTVGKIDRYLKIMAHASATGDVFLKMGCRLDGYPGGIVFSSMMDARRYISEGLDHSKGFGVFEIDADWEQDCYQSTPDAYWRNLLVDRPIKHLVADAKN